MPFWHVQVEQEEVGTGQILVRCDPVEEAHDLGAILKHLELMHERMLRQGLTDEVNISRVILRYQDMERCGRWLGIHYCSPVLGRVK
jgi:hypothetical protein